MRAGTWPLALSAAASGMGGLPGVHTMPQEETRWTQAELVQVFPFHAQTLCNPLPRCSTAFGYRPAQNAGSEIVPAKLSINSAWNLLGLLRCKFKPTQVSDSCFSPAGALIYRGNEEAQSTAKGCLAPWVLSGQRWGKEESKANHLPQRP